MRPSSEDPPLRTIRAILFWALLAGTAGTLIELLLIGHDEMVAQLVPLILLSLGLIVGPTTLVARRAAMFRMLQFLMVLFVLSGFVGVGLHVAGNQAFELEMHPSRSGLELLSKTLTGATPVLAPGSMTLLGVVGLAFTYRHPLLDSARDEGSSKEASS
jgi:hypothetical protein